MRLYTLSVCLCVSVCVLNTTAASSSLFVVLFWPRVSIDHNLTQGTQSSGKDDEFNKEEGEENGW